MKIRLPNTSHRITVVGRTGSGKTVAALWHLSNYPLQRIPFVVINFKNDEHINSIEKAEHVDLDFVPSRKDTGIFIVHPTIMDAKRPSPKEHSALEKFLFKIWERENCGVMCDEATILGANDAYDALLVQGRSKRCPLITACQRPAWITRYAFSEAEFYQIFDLVDMDDKKRVSNFCPIPYRTSPDIEEHHSWYYDVSKKQLTFWKPVPNMDEIRKAFDHKLKAKRRKWL